MNSILKKTIAVVFASVFALSTAGCSKAGSNVTIRVGSKDFTESMIVSEIYAQALENAGYKVDRKFAIAGSVIHQAITSNQIDLYPEYTGTGLLSILQLPMETDPQKVYDTVKSEYEKQFQITWLDMTAANDGQGLVIRTDVAQQYGIKTISDLQQHAADLRFCSQGEFDDRPDGIPALTATYGPFNWKSSKVYDNGIKYDVLKNNEADVTPAYTTEGALSQTDLYTLLDDDKHVWPPYNLVPIVRDDCLKAVPGIADVLNKVGQKIDTATLTKLNAEVDVDKREVADVATEFYNSIK